MPEQAIDRTYELKAEVKELKEDGTFSGVASMYDVEDLAGDIIDRGAFKKTLSENPTVPILWQHDSGEVIGEGALKEWQNKILLEGKLDIEDDPVAAKAHAKMKRGRIKGLSIGFRTIKGVWEEREEDGKTRYVRHIQELKLMEVSVVTFPALPQAQVTRVKSDDPELSARLERIEQELTALKANKATPQPEPAPTEEPPAVTPEPATDHSELSSLLNSLKEVYHNG